MAEKHKPTAKTRDLVKSMAGCGVGQAYIADIVGISQPTLRLHYRKEIDLGAEHANFQIANKLFNTAITGTGRESITAMIFWLKARANWRDNNANWGAALPPPEKEAGKKAQKQHLAETAEKGTSWEDLMAPDAVQSVN